jgi:hypothetical protein
MEQVYIPAQFTFKQGETDMGDKGKKDKGKREQQKKAQINSKEKRKLKKEKQSFASNRHVQENHNPIV